MSTNSTIGNHKNFIAKLKNYVGEKMYQQFESLKIRISHIKKIRAKINQYFGLLSSDIFKKIFLEKCKILLIKVEALEKRSGSQIRKQISEIFSDKKTEQLN